MIVCHLEDDEEGKEDEHEEEQAAGVHGQQVVFVWEIRLGGRGSCVVNKSSD